MPSLNDTAPTEQLSLDFGGTTYDRERDGERLGKQLAAVKRLMADQRWRTLAEIAAYAGGTEAAVSARLRDLRKDRFGCHEVQRRYVSRGLYEYRVLP